MKKRLLCIVLALVMLSALCACKSEQDTAVTTTAAPTITEGVEFNGLKTKQIDAAALETAVGKPVSNTVEEEGKITYYINDVAYCGLNYSVLQCAVDDELALLTLIYPLPDGTTTEQGMESVVNSLKATFGAQTHSNETNTGDPIYTWHIGNDVKNYMCLYSNTDKTLCLCFYFY